jgi:predicted AAA+ superfamily ATPase
MEEQILELSKSYAVVLLTGSRQAGKMAMMRSLAGSKNSAFVDYAIGKST